MFWGYTVAARRGYRNPDRGGVFTYGNAAAQRDPDITTGTVTIWHSLNDPDIATLVEIIADFQNQYPDSQFDVLYLPENIILERYKMAVQEGTGPSILLGPSSWVPELAENDLVSDLSSRLEPDLADRINSGALESGKSGDFQAGLPYSLDGVVLYRNQDIIPDAPTTWDELVSQARSVPEGEQIGAFLDRGFYFSGAHLEGLGGDFNGFRTAPRLSIQKKVWNGCPSCNLLRMPVRRIS